MDKGYVDLKYAKLDTDRERRTGFPEVVFCSRKTDEALVEIYRKLVERDGRAFGTRASAEQADLIRKEFPGAEYDPVSRLLKVEAQRTDGTGQTGEKTDVIKQAGKTKLPYAVVCSAGTADLPVAEEAAGTMEFFGVRVERLYDVGVSGIHRLLDREELLQGAAVVVAVAGMEGALASVIGGLVSCPVVAVPTSVGYGAAFEGLSALLTMINSCANGISVVNIDNGYGAGYIAAAICRQIERFLKS